MECRHIALMAFTSIHAMNSEIVRCFHMPTHTRHVAILMGGLRDSSNSAISLPRFQQLCGPGRGAGGVAAVKIAFYLLEAGCSELN